MRFEVLAGKHHTREGITYKKGDVLERDTDLTKVFPNKFKRLPDVASVDFPEAEKAKEKAKGKGKVKVTKKEVAVDPRGDEVTEDFKVEKGLRVFQRDDLFHIYEGDTTKPIHDKGLKSEAVEPFVKTWLEE